MKRFVFPFVLLAVSFLLAILLQTTVFSVWEVWGTRPDLIGVIVILMGVIRGPYFGGAVGILGGFLVDLTVGRMIGLNLLSKAASGWASGMAKERVFVRNTFMAAVVVFVGSVFDQSVLAVVAGAFGEGLPLTYAVIEVILPTAAYNVLIALAAYPLIQWVDRIAAQIVQS